MQEIPTKGIHVHHRLDLMSIYTLLWSSLRPGTDGDDYAVPDDALFDDEKYETQPKTIK